MDAQNEQLLERFLSSRRLAAGTSQGYGSAAATWAEVGGLALEEATRWDLEDWYRIVDARGLAAGTILEYAGKLRTLLEYAYVRGGVGKRLAKLRAADVLDGVPWADLQREVRRTQLDLDMLIRPAELGALIRTAEHPRPRALIPVAYEMGARKGEVIGARVRDVTLGPDYGEIMVTGKTGLRVLPLVRSLPSLETWLGAHPDPRPGKPLFPTVTGGRVGRMDPTAPNKLFTDLCARAGLRHLHPHQLRHTRLTELAAAGLGEYQLKSFAGWTPDSRMAARYIRLSGRAHVRAVLQAEGLDVEALGRMGPRGVAEVPGMLARVLGEVAA